MSVDLNKIVIPDSAALIQGGATEEMMGLVNQIERFSSRTRRLLNAIPDANLAGGQRRYIVEDQVTNTPPSSPDVGKYWIVGSSPTGVWSGHAGDIATKYSGDSSWTLIEPTFGVEAFDRSSAQTYIFNGTNWSLSGGASWSSVSCILTSGTGSTTATSGSDWLGTSAPTTSISRRTDDASITAAVVSGKLMRFSYSARIVPTLTTALTGGSGVNPINVGIAIFRDSETTAILWRPIASALYFDGGTFLSLIEGPYSVNEEFCWLADDSSSHVYKASIVHAYTAQYAITNLAERHFTLEVAA